MNSAGDKTMTTNRLNGHATMIAAIASNGLENVVWGIGDTREEAAEDANGYAEEPMEFAYVEIDEAQRAQIVAGNVSCESLGIAPELEPTIQFELESAVGPRVMVWGKVDGEIVDARAPDGWEVDWDTTPADIGRRSGLRGYSHPLRLVEVAR